MSNFQVDWPYKFMKKVSKVLSLKYRPQVFEDLIGQETASETIYNSIKLNKIPNAYLFTGIRGVGKTTTARIIAKALNCKNGIENLCRKNFCENCESIINSNHIDVLEMDAASKTGVDDVRDLIEFSRYGPSIARYKIFIIDEVHMLSKQAFNALLKTLEEPPEYLKFIFATTEIKKIPVTVISRCQRFDLSRVKSENLFNYIKKIKDLENGNISDDALKFIIKISEGSVRDALSLLDRVLVSQSDKELDLNTAQKIFGYFDKSSLIEMIKLLLEGKEKEVLKLFKSIYEKGIEPKVFLNDFLEILYYFKNISNLKSEGTNFSLNDADFNKIYSITNNVSPDVFMLYWQFTIKTLDELEIVANQNLSIEMFLIRLLYLKNSEEVKINYSITQKKTEKKLKSEDFSVNLNNNPVNQIKNVAQEKKTNPDKKINKIKESFEVKNFDDLINICDQKKEVKLKYELETNVKIVNFEIQKIEISFNENLYKEFVKDLSAKLYEWTNKRWLILFSNKIGMPTKKDSQKKIRDELIDKEKKTKIYKNIVEYFPDAELVEVEKKELND